MNNRIFKCESHYYKCFATAEKAENCTRYVDDKLQSMYYHNFTYIDQKMQKEKLQETIENEISLRKENGKNFCNILIGAEVENIYSMKFSVIPEISNFGFYQFDISKLHRFKTVEGLFVKQFIDKKTLDHLLYCDIDNQGESFGIDFCTKRCCRKAEEYLSDHSKINAYLCYKNEEIVGRCDLLISDNVAKIENFSVLKKYQKKGYGRAILKELIELAINKNCDLIYLVADEEDTVKEMYLKLGFAKVGISTDILFVF